MIADFAIRWHLSIYLSIRPSDKILNHLVANPILGRTKRQKYFAGREIRLQACFTRAIVIFAFTMNFYSASERVSFSGKVIVLTD